MKLTKNTVSIELTSINDNHKEYQNEIELWRAVISQALDDLTLPQTNRKYKLWRKQAIEWFSPNNQDFEIVCENAGISSEDVLKYVKNIKLT